MRGKRRRRWEENVCKTQRKEHDQKPLTALNKAFSISSYWEGGEVRGELCSRYVISVQLHWQTYQIVCCSPVPTNLSQSEPHLTHRRRFIPAFQMSSSYMSYCTFISILKNEMQVFILIHAVFYFFNLKGVSISLSTSSSYRIKGNVCKFLHV